METNKSMIEVSQEELKMYLITIIQNMAFDNSDRAFEEGTYFNQFIDRLVWLLRNKTNLQHKKTGTIQNIADRHSNGEFGKSKLTVSNFLSWVCQNSENIHTPEKEPENMVMQWGGIFKCWENLKRDYSVEEIKNKYPTLWQFFEKRPDFDIASFRRRQVEKEQDLLF